MNTKRVATGEYFSCLLYKRVENSNSYERVPIKFKARFFDPANMTRQIPITGTITSEVRLALYTSELKTKLKTQDKVVILQEEYLIDSVALELKDTPYVMGASRFSKKELENRLPKIIRMV